MPFATIRGVKLFYEVTGKEGPWVSILSGGRSDHTRLGEIAAAIAAAGYRVLSHDRRNCGVSDIVIDGTDAEYEIWAEDLHELLRHLDASPAYIAGASSGCRTSIVFALRYPQAVRGLMLLRITGGAFAAHHLAEEYYTPFIEAARRGGMAAVCETGHFKERIKARPDNRDYLMSLRPEHFIAVMSHWRDFYLRGADLPVIGATEAELRSIAAPTIVIPGNDRTHPRALAYNFVKLLPNADAHDVMGEQLDIVRTPPAVWDTKNDEIAGIFIDFLKCAEAAKRPG